MNISVSFIELLIILLVIIYIINLKKNYINYILIFLFIVFTYLLINNNYWLNFFSDYSYWKLLMFLIISIIAIILIFIMEDVKIDIVLLFLFILLGSFLIIFSSNLIMIYLGIELQSFSLVILIIKNRYSILSSEASLKYFILSSLSSGFYLLGISFLLINNIELNIDALYLINYSNFYNFTSILLLILSVFFKLGVFPFYFWVPDIYEGSNWDIVIIFSTIPKITYLVLLLKLTIFSDVFLLVGLFSIIIGSLGAFNQTKFKRFLAYSSISHMGFILIGFSYISQFGYEMSIFYMTIYIIMSLLLFLLILLSNKNTYLIDITNINMNKISSITWAIIFLSMAGIPPLGGFLIKWGIIMLSFDYNNLIITLLLLLFSIISIAYYLRLVKIIYFQYNSTYSTWENIIINKPKNKIFYYIIGLGLYFIIFIIINPSLLIIGFYNSLFYIY